MMRDGAAVTRAGVASGPSRSEEVRSMAVEALSPEGMPTHAGDLSIEGRGIEPIPAVARYGSLGRIFTVWFTPNLVPAAFFIGTLAALDFLEIGFVTGVLAILVGNLVGSILVGILGTMGPQTGMAQMPLARAAYGKSIVIPGLLNWLSCIGWDGINSIFGAAALSLLTGLPFFVSLLIIVILQAALTLSAGWIEVLGLAVADKATGESVDVIHSILGGGLIGGLAMIAIALGTVAVNALNDYTGSLSLLAAGIRVPRVASAFVVAVLGFFFTLYLNSGDFGGKFTGYLLFLSYWIAPWAAVLLVDWMRRGGRVDANRLMRFAGLPSGFLALASLIIGFVASLPFQQSTFGEELPGSYPFLPVNVST